MLIKLSLIVLELVSNNESHFCGFIQEYLQRNILHINNLTLLLHSALNIVLCKEKFGFIIGSI